MAVGCSPIGVGTEVTYTEAEGRAVLPAQWLALGPDHTCAAITIHSTLLVKIKKTIGWLVLLVKGKLL